MPRRKTRAGDVVFYECQVPVEDLPAEFAVPDCRTAVAMSVLHPACPARRSTVRARLLVAVTMFTPDGNDTIITSIQQCAPALLGLPHHATYATD